MANFNPYIDKIDISVWCDLCRRNGTLRSYPKGAYFLRAGEIPEYFGFIESGCFKYSVIDTSGEEHITGFAPANALAGDFYGTVRNTIALNELQAATDSTVWVIDTCKVREWLDVHPEYRMVLAEELFRMTHERYLNLYLQSPKERYVELLKRCPEILQMVSLKELASYLKITPTHLSRIRKEMSFGK